MKQPEIGNGITRRESLARAAAAFTILPAGLSRAYAANDKLNIGIIGLDRGLSDLKALNDLGQNIAAICDVDSTLLEKVGATYPKAQRHTDFRKMMETEKLDGVVVAVPDHSHAYISVWAMKHGIHVYCEKPLTQTMQEARVMAKVAAETKSITQMGTSSTAEPRNLRLMEMIQSGALGEITEVHLATDRPVWPQGFDRPAGDQSVPSTLAWDTWIGPAAMRPFLDKWAPDGPVYRPEERKKYIYTKGDVPVYHPFVWRGWTEYGSGAVGDIAPHSMNVIFMALDLGAPSAVEVLQTSGMAKEMYPSWSIIRWEWPQRGIHPPFRIYWYDGGKLPPDDIRGRIPQPPPAPGAPPVPVNRGGGGGLTWIGTKGSLPQGRGPYLGQKMDPYPIPPQKDWGREDVYKDWVAGVRNGKPPSCNFGYAGPFTEAYQLANVALKVGHRVEWDALEFRVTNCREANQYLSREYRKGWDLKAIAGSAAFDVKPSATDAAV